MTTLGPGEEAALSTTEKATLLQGEFGKEGGISFSVLERLRSAPQPTKNGKSEPYFSFLPELGARV